MPPSVYAGATARTRREPVVYLCACGERFRAEVHRAVDVATDPALASALSDGRLNELRCPACDTAAVVEVSVVVHDPAARRLILALPEGLRHRELDELAQLFSALAADREPAPAYVLRPTVVVGAAALRAALAQPGEAPSASTPPVEERAAAGPPPVEQPAAAAPNHAAALALAAAAASPPARDPDGTNPRAPMPFEDIPTAVEPSRPRVAVPDPKNALVDRWIAAREGPTAFLVDDEVYVCASVPPATLEALVGGELELRVQLHRMPTYPIVAILLLNPTVGGAAPSGEARGGAEQPSGRSGTLSGLRATIDENRAFLVPLDVARAAHRVVLDELGRRAAVTVELYDTQYLPVVSHRVSAPLEENVRRLVLEATDALDRLAPPVRSFDRARAALFHPTYDRLGRTPIHVPLDEHELAAMERPSAVLGALAAVGRWSEPSAEAYLVEIRSIPLERWRQARARVIERAVELGLWVSRTLLERASRDGLTLDGRPPPSWSELLASSLRRFAEVAARRKPNDLSAAEEAENWERLLRECAQAGVPVDDTAKRLQQAAARRARTTTTGAGVDLRAMETTELVALLERKELRREAAIVLCERGDTTTLPALFSTIRKLPRAEANLVLPSVTSFGAAAERYLLDGLRSKKSYVRQGCALALGVLGSPAAVDALAQLLVFEPTEIWSEVARALGDVGAAAVQPLVALLREALGQPAEAGDERRARIVGALAHVAARGGAAGRLAIEKLAEGRTSVAAEARRALALVPDIRAADEVVRPSALAAAAAKEGGPPPEVTVVRGFSRRFYEALSEGAGARELDAQDLEEVVELDGEAAAAAAPDDGDGDGDGDGDEQVQDLSELAQLADEYTPAAGRAAPAPRAQDLDDVDTGPHRSPPPRERRGSATITAAIGAKAPGSASRASFSTSGAIGDSAVTAAPRSSAKSQGERSERQPDKQQHPDKTTPTPRSSLPGEGR
jgi:hypothetical protein